MRWILAFPMGILQGLFVAAILFDGTECLLPRNLVIMLLIVSLALIYYDLYWRK